MHSAPAVRYPVPRSACAGRVLAVLCALPSIPLLFWWRDGAQPAALAIFVAVWCCTVLFAARQWRGMRRGQLRWDGQAWCWLPDGDVARSEHPVTVDLRLDMQAAVLVRAIGMPGWVHWLFLEQSAAPAHWHALRRALHEGDRAAALAPHPLP